MVVEMTKYSYDNAIASVAIVMVNYNAGELLACNLQRIIDSVGQDIALKIFIVDNQSTDNSFDLLSRQLNTSVIARTVILIQAEKNGGFAYGNNIGIKAVLKSGFSPDYFYFLNPDAVPEKKAIEILINESKKLKDNCILGSQMLNQDNSKAASAFRYPSIVSEFNRGIQLGVVNKIFKRASLVISTDNYLTPCDWVCGAGFLLPLKVFQKIGYMDESYFLYFEEVDYMKHAKNMHVFIGVVNKSNVIHIAGVSTGIVRGKAKAIPDYWYRSWNRYFYKNHGLVIGFSSGLCWVLGRNINYIISLVVPSRRSNDGHSVFKFIRKAMNPFGAI